MKYVESGILLVTLLASASLQAATEIAPISLEDALNVEVESASRFLQPLSEAPADVTVISADDIRGLGYRNLAEALQSVPGVYATDDRSYTYLGIRGFARPGDYNTRILFLTDGIRRNDPIYNQATVGNDAPIDLDWIRQVEFVPGAASSLYGGNALFGIVNTVLWSGADIDGSRGSVEIGSDGLAHVSLLSGRQLDDGSDWIVGVAAYQKSGADLHFPEFDVPGTSNGVAHGLDGERDFKAFAKLVSGDWKFDISYSTRRKNVPTAYYDTLFDVPGNYNIDDYAFADISQSTLLDSRWTRYLRLTLGAYHYDSHYVYPGVVSKESASSRWIGAEYRLTYLDLRNHKLMLGAEFEVAPRLNQFGVDLDPATVYLDDRRTSNSAGLYVNDDWQFAHKWALNLGVRADRLRTFGDFVSPRAALIFHPDPESSVKLIHGRAFRPPNAYERFYNDGNFSQKDNPGLMPEEITSDELVVKFPVTSAVRLSGNYYQYKFDHLVDQETDPTDGLAVFTNRPRFHAHGLELEAEAVSTSGFRFDVSMTWQALRQNFAVPVNSPSRLMKLLIDGPLRPGGWTVGFTAQAISRRSTVGGSTVPGYLNANLVFNKLARKRNGGRWSLGIYNIAGKRHLDPAPPGLLQDSLPTDDRQLLLRWETGF